MQPMATVQSMGAAWAQVGGCLQPLCSRMGWRGQVYGTQAVQVC